MAPLMEKIRDTSVPSKKIQKRRYQSYCLEFGFFRDQRKKKVRDGFLNSKESSRPKENV